MATKAASKRVGTPYEGGEYWGQLLFPGDYPFKPPTDAKCLIGLLSFMCTDELTTGSVLVSARERRLLAAKSHAYNLRQRRFTQLFPEYTGPVAKDLPNMSRPAAAPAVTAPAAAKAPEKPAPTSASGATPANPTPPASDDAAPPPAPPPAQNAASKWRIFFWVACSVAGVLFANKVLEKLAM
ncbi:E2 ubiquitin-conjugating enzyme [Malassezia brasiliensis]|uniref:E2 ubiquitin-conjugating enzyme n=1 Tax=Malassezia brasiliensis TaxID=1821822 RepID=A0AAF0DTI1_9BASI|nr:E2 ubiquitin-conjugating enzyme [Malassezia brasiliensis]